MSKIAYVDKLPGEEVLEMIGQANKILDTYKKQGLVLTLRQLYYRFVATGLLANEARNYSRLGNAMNQGRMCGLVDWNMLEDRTRRLMGQDYYDSALDAVSEARDAFQMDKWNNQDWRPEVWVEKDAQVAIVAKACNELGVNYLSCRGYNSQSVCWRAGQRFAHYIHKGQRPIVFHLGDHDPSGLHMSEDNSNRLNIFAGVPVTFMRLALNMDQIRKYAPPPNVAKESDSRHDWYVNKTGTTECWELDALEPNVVHQIITDAVLKVRDPKKWDEALQYEAEERDQLNQFVEELTPPDGEG